jgi:hypothetical protein
MPQAVLLDAWHWPLESQQPPGHEFASQTHLPCALHSWLALQAEHTVPPSPHAVLDEPTHVPEEQQPLQLTFPQLHAPLLHVWPELQAPHALPAEPQRLAD